MKSPRLLAAVAALSFALSGCGDSTQTGEPASQFADVDDARLRNAAGEPEHWLTHGGTWNEQRYSALAQVNAENVDELKPAWYFEFDTNRGQEATPIVVDGVMYVTTAWSKVYALDAATGRQLWFFDPEVPGPAGVPTCCDVVNRGAAVYEGKVYVGTIDGRLIALDAATGTTVWSAQTVEPASTYTITGAPRAARGKVFIGNAGADFGGRGYVSAYDAEDGTLAWRFYVVPGDPAGEPDGAASDEALAKVALPTWFGDDWKKYGGGGHAWNAIVFDEKFNHLYMATGNGYPWNQRFRSAGQGDNLFIASIVAVDADTGEYKWHYQETPGDIWDYDAIADMVLVDVSMEGEERSVLLHPSKNGFLYVIDRENGQLVSAEAYVPGVNWATHVDLKTGRPDVVAAARYEDEPWTGVPGSGGAHNWHPVAFSPATGLLYLAASENSTFFLPTESFEFKPGQPNLGVDLTASFRGGRGGAHGADANPQPAAGPPPSPPKSYLLAWDPVKRAAAWRADTRGGGVLATAGNLVFQGRNREGVLGELTAYRADTGEQLWSYRTPNAVAAGPITYRVGDEQYVAASSGASFMSLGGKARVRDFGRLVAFKLNGTATLPPDPPLAPPANPPQQVASQADYVAGEVHYDGYCSRCHGFGTQSSNVVPDLRRSPMLTHEQAWQDIVMDGALTARGMIGWSEFLTREQSEQIRAYVGEEARKLQEQEHEQQVGSR